MRSSFLVAAFSLSLAGTAFAQSTTGPSAEDVKKAGDEFDQGKRSYKAKNWVEAAEHFEAADSLAPSAVALEWAMKARDKADQLDRAATLGSLALTRHSDRADLVKNAESLMKRARKSLGEVKVRCEPACGLVVGTKLVPGGAVSERVVFLPPGAVELRASWSGGRSKSAPVQAAKGSTVELNFTAPPEEKAGPSEPAASGAAVGAGSSSKPGSGSGQPSSGSSAGGSVEEDKKIEPGSGLPPAVFWIGTGLTVVAGGVSVWSGLDTQNNPGADRVRDECVGEGEDCSLYQDGLDRQRRTNILLGVTGGLALTTIVIGAFFTNWRGDGDQKESAKAARVEPFVGIGSLGARGSF